MQNYLSFKRSSKPAARTVMFGMCLAASIATLNVDARAAAQFTQIDWPGAGSNGTTPFSINSNGMIAGIYWDGGNIAHGLLRDTDGTLTGFDVPGANGGTVIHQISDNGTMIGDYSNNTDHSGAQYGFVRLPGGTLDTFLIKNAVLMVPNSVNADGTIAGTYYDANNVAHGFRRSATAKLHHFDIPGAGTGAYQGTRAFGINNKGAVAGYYEDANGAAHGFVQTPNGQITTFDAADAGTGHNQGTFATSINYKGAIAGSYSDGNGHSHGFLLTPDGTITEFDAPAAVDTSVFSESGSDINGNGAVAGSYKDNLGNSHGFVRTAEGKFLTFDAPVATPDFDVESINSHGVVTGGFYDSNLVLEHGFVWNR